MELYILSATLLAINIYTLIQHHLYVKESNRNTRDLLKALMAKDLPEFTDSVKKEEPFDLPSPPEEEFIPMAEALEDEDVLKKMVAGGYTHLNPGK